MKKDATTARLIRGLQDFIAVIAHSQRQSIVQTEVQAVSAKAQKLAVIANYQLKVEERHAIVQAELARL